MSQQPPSLHSPQHRLPLAPALAPILASPELGARVGDPRAALQAIASAGGFHHVQLGATIPGMRPRELDRSARRDLLARLRRVELIASGIDLFIPEEHFVDPQHVDRACAAVVQTILLAADLGRVPVSLRLPDDRARVPTAVLSEIRNAADMCGVIIADFAGAIRADNQGGMVGKIERLADERRGPVTLGELTTESASEGPPGEDWLATGIDTAEELLSGRDPAASVSRAGRLGAIRLSDARGRGISGTRVIPGTGALDILALQVALLSRGAGGGDAGPVVLDLRQLSHPIAALSESLSNWVKTGLLNIEGI